VAYDVSSDRTDKEKKLWVYFFYVMGKVASEIQFATILW
jgi:hypothetical protein